MEEKGARGLFYQHMLKPHELALVIPNANECLFAIHTKLTERDYNVAVYKYGKEYFVLNDVRIFKQIQGIDQESQGDEEELLPYVEEAFEDNCYNLVEEKLVQLDLNILSTISANSPVQVRYYEFVDFT
ncbi:hypothetical protein LQF63_00600 [Tetragenococcus koreensis]|nr:hypothetical protein [Tetragenococcus koreensis]MCF1616168.1 hypothetical protein [Tetragenococcus koreensis]MDN6664042.1 hypothetical protein [Tetragenococcus koreensis]